ncbi:NAD(P)-dependent oxidoreductase [Ferrovibrio sp.]|uniref:NAD-dependent epimerase/dehydratase family protein n=1 Tax=Ferrovibrio sp. TaxID=1917215 RepID=UPI00262C4C0F|nr:NAD(P)-dependent oxidoreductase [Ferrovibrio sp.]
MTILVSGGTGYIGRHLVRHLIAQGETVHVLCQPDSDTTFLPAAVTIHRGIQAADLPAVLSGLRPQTCFHLATRYQHDYGPADIAPLLDSNLVFGTTLADAAMRSGCRSFINAGTASQMDRDGNYAPASLYAASKQAFEDLLAYFALRRGMACRTVLLYDTYGPQDTRGKLLMNLIASARTGMRLELSPGEQEVDLLHIGDAIDGLLAAAAATDQMARYALSSGSPLSLRQLASMIERIAGRAPNIAWGARPYRDGEIMQTWKTGTPPPGWRPQRRLEDFLRAELGG